MYITVMRWTSIYLDEARCRQLDRLARRRGISRAALIRELIDHALGGQDADVADDLAAIDESFGALPDLDLERGPDERWAHLQRITGA